MWLHLRTSPIRWSLPVLLAVDLAALFLRNRSWIGVWPESGAAAQVPAYLLGVVAAGVAAWAAGTQTRHRLGEQLAVARVHPATSEAYRLGATLILLLIPYVIGQVVAFAVTARTFPPGLGLFWGYALLGLFVMVMATARSTPDYQTDAPTEMQAAWARGRGIAAEQSLPEQFRWADREVGDLRGRYCRPVR